MNKMKKLLLACFTFMVLALGGKAMTLQAQTIDEITVPVLSDASQLESVSAAYTKELILGEPVDLYFKFTLSEDSWVIFKGNHSLYNHDGVASHVTIYSDSAFSNKKMEYGWGYWEYDNEATAFLTKGTYYGMIHNTHENYQADFKGNVNVVAGAIPISKVFEVQQKADKNKKSVTVVWSNVLGSYCSDAQYREGEVSLANVNDQKYWKWKYSFGYTGGDDKVQVLDADGNNNYSFKATKNTSFTIMLQDTEENRYSKVIKVTGIDTTKPKVTGVKNGKTYKKAVTIKFSDKQSGIKSATLNNKKIKSGKKVSKAGSYTLVVKDKAGNTTKIKFKIKK